MGTYTDKNMLIQTLDMKPNDDVSEITKAIKPYSPYPTIVEDCDMDIMKNQIEPTNVGTDCAVKYVLCVPHIGPLKDMVDYFYRKPNVWGPLTHRAHVFYSKAEAEKYTLDNYDEPNKIEVIEKPMNPHDKKVKKAFFLTSNNIWDLRDLLPEWATYQCCMQGEDTTEIEVKIYGRYFRFSRSTNTIWCLKDVVGTCGIKILMCVISLLNILNGEIDSVWIKEEVKKNNG